MTKRRSYLFFTILCLLAGRSTAYTDNQYQAIVELGALNGIALQCKYLDQTRKIKKSLIGALPKRRALGQAFEIATNNAFLKFIEKSEACPRSTDFSKRVDRQITVLNNAFAVTTER